MNGKAPMPSLWSCDVMGLSPMCATEGWSKPVTQTASCGLLWTRSRPSCPQLIDGGHHVCASISVPPGACCGVRLPCDASFVCRHAL